MKPNDNNSLAHTTWNCQKSYSICAEVSQKDFYKEIRVEIGKILRELCNWKQVKIVEAEVCPDHIHMLVEIPPKMSVSSFVGFLKGKSSLIIFERHSNLKYKYGNRQFGAEDTTSTQQVRMQKRLQSISKTSSKRIRLKTR